jgi:DNA repair protein RadC
MAVLGLRVQNGSAEQRWLQTSGSYELEADAATISTYTEGLRERFSGVNLLEDGETSAATLLGQALALVYPVPVAELLSKQVLSAFGSLGASLAAGFEQVQATVPNGSGIFLILRAIHRLLVGTLREKIQDGLHLRNSVDLHNYLKLTLSHEPSEQVRLLHVDSQNKLIRDEVHALGTTNQIAIYPREIVKRALEMNASALIIVHNHPSGDPTPSVEDIDMTRLLTRALNAINIHLHDHVVVGRGECFSMKAEGLL